MSAAITPDHETLFRLVAQAEALELQLAVVKDEYAGVLHEIKDLEATLGIEAEDLPAMVPTQPYTEDRAALPLVRFIRTDHIQ